VQRKLICIVNSKSKEITFEIDCTRNGLGKYKPKTLQKIIPKRILANIKYFGVSAQSWINAARKRSELFYQLPRTNFAKIRPIVDFFEISKETYINSLLKYPALLTSNPQKIIDNSLVSTMMLGITLNDFLVIALKKPQLFCQSSDTLHQNFQALANYFGNERKARQEIIKSPILLTYAQERTIIHHKLHNLTGVRFSLKLNPVTCLHQFAQENPDYFSTEKLLKLTNYFKDYISQGKKTRQGLHKSNYNFDPMNKYR